MLCASSLVSAEVSVVFTNSTLPQATTNELGTLTLSFNINGSGSVTLDASTTSGEQIVIDAVNAWDGLVGAISHTGAFSSVFSLVLNDAGGSGLKLTSNGGGGLGVGGQNAWRIDRPGTESIVATVGSLNGKVSLNAVSWNNRANTTVELLLNAPSGSYSNSLGALAGTWNVSGNDVSLFSGQQLSLGNANLGDINDGYALAGISFDVVDGTPPPAFADLVPDAGVSAGSYTTESFDGRTVWVPDNTATQLFFNVPGSFGFIPGQPVYMRIEYHDDGSGRLFAEYDSNQSDTYKNAEIHARSSRVGQGGFIYSYQMFESPEFAGGQTGGNDFRFKLLGTDGTPLRIAGVQISTTPYGAGDFQYALSKPWLLPNTGPVKDFTDNQTLAGKVMTGYQGWFATPNDPDDLGWRHWGRSSNVDPSPTEITIDMWPHLNDYQPSDLFPAGQMIHQDGRPAYLFSSRNPDVVQRHFRWMRKHNIDGAYLQRFVSQNSGGYNGGPEFVLDNVRKAAASEGRVWAIEYDVSSLDTATDPFAVITNDWNFLLNECDILDDPRYIHEDGKPVLFIWGFSVDGRNFTVAQANEIVDWFAAQGLYLIAGVNDDWQSKTAWHGHYQKYDQLLGWMESNLGNLNSQKIQLNSWGMKILPHAWPGFSWHNLKQLTYPSAYTARNGGDFYWDRLYNAVSCGADQIFLGMFDEYDEGTAIMPMSDNHPDPHTAWGHYIDNAGRDPFWWLRLSGTGRDMLNGFRALNGATPTAGSASPVAYGGDDATVFLGTNNVEAGLIHTQPGDGLTGGTFIGNQDCRTNANPYVYFNIDDTFCNSVSEGQAATIELEYYDDTAGTVIRLHYDSLSAAYTVHPTITTTPGTGGWKNIRWNVTDGFFGNRQNGPSDFRISIPGGKVVAIHRVSVFLPEEQGGADDAALEFVNDGLEWPVEYDAVGWRLSESDNLVSNNWQETSSIVITNGVVRHEMTYTNSAGFYQLRRPARQ
ncbi:hypothetical protein SCARR_05662 [Pontiella sulfatireligans]|uniref:Uncharacterized protein n=2 Tax=Pontiella sulfatireligans TaxID=2750658 RepID=A0A6C2UTA7_9BACT|nr:hypothetical protein SCARR_05662 [Pontiella sulfatireligans]